MSGPDFSLSTPKSDAIKGLVVGWLYVALASLVGAGLVVILIILARTPVIHDLIPWVGSFKTALVIHVDLSVLVWFMAFAGLLTALIMPPERAGVARLTIWLAGLATVIITFSPFLGVDAPYMNNYIPVLENEAFFVGIMLFTGASVVMSILGLIPGSNRSTELGDGEWAMRFGIRTALAIFLLSVALWIWSYAIIPDFYRNDPAEREFFYEVLFWAGGHTLQYTHTQLLAVVWLWLAVASALTPRLSAPVLFILLILGALPVLYAPVIQMIYPVESLDHREAHTWLMRDGNGLAVVPIALLIMLAWFRQGMGPAEARPVRFSLLFSLVLFAAGGIIGFLISGVNTIIPAHYHGSIIAITMAYMGLTYLLLPRLGYQSPHLKLATWQPVIYGIGQLMHILGLAWSGGHGMARKTAGAEQGLDTLQKKIAMGMMGAGGIIAVIAGILFLVLVFRALRRPVASVA